MKKIFTFFLLAAATPFVVHAQEASSARITPGNDGVTKPGTYVYVYKSREFDENVTLTGEQMTRLETLRQQSDVVYVQFSEKTIIKLLPKDVVNAPGYTPSPNNKIFIVEEADYYNYANLKTVSF